MNSKLLGALAAVALLAACSDKDKAGEATGAGAATSGPVPGSQEDLVSNVGDRVFFDFDRSSLRDDARATLDRQAGWLGKYPQFCLLGVKRSWDGSSRENLGGANPGK